MLLQVNETTLSNIRWENNTFVHHADSYSPSIAMIYQADLEPGTVIFNNNLVIFDGANSFMGGLDDAMSASNNLIVESDPGVANLGGIQAEDFDLVEGSAAIDAGLPVSGHPLDFLNRTVPDPSGATDIGAFEYGSAQGAELPETAQLPDTGTAGSDPGSEGTGAASAATGGPRGSQDESAADGTNQTLLPANESGCGCFFVAARGQGQSGRLGLILAIGGLLLGRRRVAVARVSSRA
jgi:hypothetical protein